MSDLIETLITYSETFLVRSYLRTPEYRQAIYDLEEHWTRFRSLLTAEQTQDLENVLAQEGMVHHMEDRAAFQAALSIGISLGRL